MDSSTLQQYGMLMRYVCSEIHRHISKLICIAMTEKLSDINIATLMSLMLLMQSFIAVMRVYAFCYLTLWKSQHLDLTSTVHKI